MHGDEGDEWTAILNSLKTTFGSTKIEPADLIAANLLRAAIVVSENDAS